MALLNIVWALSSFYTLEPKLVLSVMYVESGYRKTAIGRKGEIAYLQLMPSSFPQYTTKQLKDPAINILLGIKYLYTLKKTCKHTQDHTYLICYNVGPANAFKIKHPKKHKYYRKVMQKYMSLNVFKPKDQVVIMQAYANGGEGRGEIISFAGINNKGESLYLVKIDDLTIKIENSRLLSESEWMKIHEAERQELASRRLSIHPKKKEK